MKKCLVIIVALAVFTTLCAAQNVTGNLNYQAQYDVMGAHENGGRGCAGCHAPHSGGRGSGGNTMSDGTINAYGVGADGWGGLWGTDTTAITTNYASGLTFNGNSSHTGTLTGISNALNWSSPIYTGVVTCLSCHDGAVSKGAMMAGVAYEQAFGLLNGASYMSANRNSALSSTIYGPNPIPTLLGNDGASTVGTGAAGYANDHPLGQTANIGAVIGSVYKNAAMGLSISANGSKLTVTPGAAGTPYGDFAASYNTGALAGMVGTGDGNPDNFFIVCTTCHNQHNMAVYGGGHGQGAIAGSTTARTRTIFFVNGPYNPGAPYDPQHIPSTMAFCQQCHFSMSSQYYGAGQHVGVAF